MLRELRSALSQNAAARTAPAVRGRRHERAPHLCGRPEAADTSAVELRLTAFVEADELAIQNGVPRAQCGYDLDAERVAKLIDETGARDQAHRSRFEI